MLKTFAKKLIGAGHATAAQFTLPPVVFEIAPGFATGVAIEGSKRKGKRIRKLSLQSLGVSTLDPHLSRNNIVNGGEFSRAVADLVAAVGNGDGRYGMIVPDGAVRVTQISFESLPDDAEATEALIRWRMRERLPFSPDEGRISFQVLGNVQGQIEVLAMAMRQSVIDEYESAFTALNAKSVLIIPATVALLPLLPEGIPGAQAVIHLCGRWLTVVVLAGSIPMAWRTRELDPLDDAHSQREIALETARVVASALDRSQTQLSQVWLCARPPVEKSLTAAISETMAHEVATMRPPSEMISELGADERSKFEQFGSTFAGLLANDK